MTFVKEPNDIPIASGKLPVIDFVVSFLAVKN
jgi:hypothetical protein